MLDRLPRSDLLHILDISTRCLSVTSFADLEAVVSEVEGIIPFEKAAICAAAVVEDGPSLTHYVNHSYGAEWPDVYSRLGFQRVDPVLNHAPRVSGSFTWRDAFQREGARATAAFNEAAMDFGLVDGVSFTCASRGRAPAIRTVLSLARVGEEHTTRALALLRAVGPHVHEAYLRLLPSARSERCSIVLSAREREVLAWAQEGKTYWETGCILGISSRTVKFHFASIKAKLDVTSPCHAVAKALKLGLIE